MLRGSFRLLSFILIGIKQAVPPNIFHSWRVHYKQSHVTLPRQSLGETFLHWPHSLLPKNLRGEWLCQEGEGLTGVSGKSLLKFKHIFLAGKSCFTRSLKAGSQEHEHYVIVLLIREKQMKCLSGILQQSDHSDARNGITR